MYIGAQDGKLECAHETRHSDTLFRPCQQTFMIGGRLWIKGLQEL